MIKNALISLGILIPTLFVINSCSITKHVPKGEYLLDNNNFKIKEDTSLLFTKHDNIDVEEMQGILKQKPNRKAIGGIRAYLRLYNLSSEKRIQKKRLVKIKKAEKKNKNIVEQNKKRRLKTEAKNKKRAEKAKKNNISYLPIRFIPKPLVEPKPTFGERVRESGEAPVIIDTAKTITSAKQLNLYLINKGYFNNEVNFNIKLFPDTIKENGEIVKIKHKRKQNRGEIDYLINLKEPYRIKGINYKIKDSTLASYINSIRKKSIIDTNQIYDSEKLSKERERITAYLLNNGYKFFNKEFIHFKIDSNLRSNKVNVELRVQNYKQKDPVYDTIIKRNHAQYKITEIEILSDYSNKAEIYDYKDTLLSSNTNIKLINRKPLQFKPKLLYNSLKFEEGELYNKDKITNTYRTFASLGTFKATAIEFDTLNNGNNDLVAKIKLEPTKMQSFTIATDGTHRNGLFGIEGRIAYSHKNIFKGAEQLQISLSGGIEMQQSLVNQDVEEGIETTIPNLSSFNTLEFGPIVSLTIPRFVFLNKFFPNAYNPKTDFTGVINFQRRPDFTRNKENFSFGYVWHENKTKTYRFTPFNISAIKIDKSAAFQATIDKLNDRLLAASYQDHIIASSKLSFTYNGQNRKKKKQHVFYFESELETAGNSLRALYSLTNQPLNAQGAYEFLGIRFAQFAKISTDIRHYNNFTNRVSLVSRLAGGVGVPLRNLKEALPFEESFFSGGANGLRAWRARTMGPGAYYDSTTSFDKIGDIKIEANLELRFPISSWINGAVFLDAGNIWLLNEDSLRTGGQFKIENAIPELGLGTGFGLRMDLDFFIIRFDFAMPIKNPSLPKQERWIVRGKWNDVSGYPDGSLRKDFFPWQFNLGIGYPF